MSDQNTFNTPYKLYTRQAKKMISMRLPQSMVTELKNIAVERGWTLTDVVQTALEQFIKFNKEENKSNKEAA